MHRRDVLKLMAGTCIGAMSARILAPITARAADKDALDVTLTARLYRFSPNPKVSFSGLAFNGQIPGPVLRTRPVQKLRARFINHTGHPSTIHWHGMILPNDMDGVPDVTQKPVPDGGEFLYEYMPNPPGFRWYHSHVQPQLSLGMFGAFIVDDPRDEPADVEVVLVLHDVPDMHSFKQALAGVSTAKVVGPIGSPEMGGMMKKMEGMHKPMTMGDAVAYTARCINGATYPRTKPITVNVGQRVRLRILNASPTLTHYVALGDHSLRVTHSDGNHLPRPVNVDALRIGVAERYDAWFEVTKPGAWLLEAISNENLALGQSVRIQTPGMEHVRAIRPNPTLEGVKYFTYQLAGKAGPLHHPLMPGHIDVDTHFQLGGGKAGDPSWTINGKTWPHTPKILVRKGNRVLVRFHNPTDMEHPMHLHGHVFKLVEINGQSLQMPLPKDTTLVPANGGTATWFFEANSPPGRWVLHCHNAIHLADGMMTEVQYID